jgi:hypothetical protein
MGRRLGIAYSKVLLQLGVDISLQCLRMSTRITEQLEQNREMILGNLNINFRGGSFASRVWWLSELESIQLNSINAHVLCPEISETRHNMRPGVSVVLPI